MKSLITCILIILSGLTLVKKTDSNTFNSVFYPISSRTFNVSAAERFAESKKLSSDPEVSSPVLGKNTTAPLMADNDNDGVPDVDDLDDDNDGILDTDECICYRCPLPRDLVTNGDFSGFYLVGWTQDNGANWQEGGLDHNNQRGIYVVYEGYGLRPQNLRQTISLTPGTTYTLSFELGTFSNNSFEDSSVLEVRMGNDLLYVASSHQVNNANGGNFVDNGGGNHSNMSLVTMDYTATSNSEVLSFRGIPSSAPHDEFFLDTISISEKIDCVDTDNDNIPDYLDSDSDNDGCNDVTEAGFTDGDGNGYLGSGTHRAGLTVDSKGVVTSGTDGYTAPVDGDGSGTRDFIEPGAVPTINTQPSDQEVFIDQNGNFTIAATGSNITYQWQRSTDGGINFNDLSDNTEYSGTQTNTLSLQSVPIEKDGYRYRVVMASTSYLCGTTTSNSVLLNMRVRTIITNRRITYRVKKS